jgi:hypothetical protein
MHMRLFFACLFLLFIIRSSAQSQPKQLPAQRTTAEIKVDGLLDEAVWKEIEPATGFVEWRPNAGKLEDSANRTFVYFLYDNTSVYIGGYCHERTKDSISRELIGRDQVGINDFVGVILDTYNDKINAVGFYVTPYGEQFDAKYSNSGDEDDTWNAVWDSEAKVHNDGWSFEMRIPYSALRFVSKEQQKWGLNITRRRNKTGQQYMWNPVNPQVNGFVNQEGEWTGIGKIEAPVRLSFSPYLTSYINHDRLDTKDWRASVNGGMDVKYGLSESFTLDMTLIPDFGQVPSDAKVLNLSPFEVKYQENRAFFTEGTELFNKGELFYSRRIGAEPLRYWDVEAMKKNNINVIENPAKSKLLNATKISGRTKKGLGLGLFNAITKPMFATIEDASKMSTKIKTNPLTNYNIIVFDQTLKNNSSVSFINTNVLRSGHDYDANVSAALFNFNNKKNTYNWNGKVSVSRLIGDAVKNANGYSHNLGFGKTGGRFNFQINQELVDDKYNIADMGYFTAINYFDHYLWMGYKWTKPGNWFNQLRINYNLGHSLRFTGNKYQSLFTNVNANAQLKNLSWVGGFIGYNPEGNDYNEPRKGGDVFFTTSKRLNLEAWFESNNAKKYSFGGDVFTSIYQMEKGRSYFFNVFHKYRFNDKLSISQSINYQPFLNNVGFDGFDGNHVVFALRDRNTIENSISAKYNFNNKSGITLRIRHYWSEVDKSHFYDLNSDGSITTYTPTVDYKSTNFSFNQFTLFAEYTKQFAPGSFINIVWKNENDNEAEIANHQYFKNFNRTLSDPHVNNLSIRILYYLDYLDLKKWRKKKA